MASILKAKMRNAFKSLVGRIEGRLSRRWESNIKMNPKEIGCEDVDWINLAYSRVP
jgi:hypothetical protein